jgi:integrase
VTVGHARSLLSAILSGAEDAGYIPANKLYGRRIAVAKNAAKRKKEEQIWAPPEEAYRLYDRLGSVHGLMVLSDCYLGLRWGELTGLHRDNCLLKRTDRVAGKPFVRYVVRIDPEVGALHEDEFELDADELAAWHAAENARLAECREKGWKANRRKEPKAVVKLYLGEPKNDYSAREVDVPPFLVKLLAEHIENWKYEHPFTTPSGDWWRRGNFGRVLGPAAKGRKAIERKVGFAGRGAWEPILPGFNMRGARHTHDTWMKDDRVDRALRFLTMGWVPKDIEGTYEHVTPEMRKHRLDCLEARWKRGQG